MSSTAFARGAAERTRDGQAVCRLAEVQNEEYLLKSDVMNEIDRLFEHSRRHHDDEAVDVIAGVNLSLKRLKTYQLPDRTAPCGQWLPNYDRDAPTYDSGLMIRYFHCSVCKGDISDRYGLYRYCPHCGAKMEE